MCLKITSVAPVFEYYVMDVLQGTEDDEEKKFTPDDETPYEKKFVDDPKDVPKADDAEKKVGTSAFLMVDYSLECAGENNCTYYTTNDERPML